MSLERLQGAILMSYGDARESLATASGMFLGFATLCDRRDRTMGVPYYVFDSALRGVVTFLESWNTGDPEKFSSLELDIFVPLVCHDVLRQRDGKGSWHNPAIEDVRCVVDAEVANLRALASESGDYAKAKRFCLALAQVGLLYMSEMWRPSFLAT